MTPEQLQILATELENLEYALLDSQQAADALNLADIVNPFGRVAIKDLKGLTMITPIGLTAGGAANLWYIVKMKALAGVVPMAILYDLFTDIDFQSIDFIEGGIQKAMLTAGLDNLVADADLIFSETDKDNIMAAVLALAPNISRATQLELPTVYYYEVGQARAL